MLALFAASAVAFSPMAAMRPVPVARMARPAPVMITAPLEAVKDSIIPTNADK